MPYRDTMTFFGEKVACFNIEFAVGKGQPNAPNDVMLIQMMFNYIVHGTHSGDTLGITQQSEVPRMSSHCDDAMLASIQKYQNRWKHNLLEADGKIDPAHYHYRDLQIMGTTPRLTITLLHQHCQGAAAQLNEADYTEHMQVVFPGLRFILNPALDLLTRP